MELVKKLPMKQDKGGKNRPYGLFKCSYCQEFIRKNLWNGKKDKSCGCMTGIFSSKQNTTHGMSNTRLHQIWRNMRYRCYNSKSHCSKTYHDRKIIICEEWKDDFSSFHKWATNNGYSDNLTIDRRNNNKNYSPDNCRWISICLNARNKTTTKLSVSTAIEIRKKYVNSQITQEKLGLEYNISLSHACRIIHNKAWREDLL